MTIRNKRTKYLSLSKFNKDLKKGDLVCCVASKSNDTLICVSDAYRGTVPKTLREVFGGTDPQLQNIYRNKTWVVDVIAMSGEVKDSINELAGSDKITFPACLLRKFST